MRLVQCLLLLVALSHAFIGDTNSIGRRINAGLSVGPRDGRVRLFGMTKPPGGGSSNDDFDVEQARRQLKAMFSSESSATSTTSNHDDDEYSVKSLLNPTKEIALPPPPPMTSIDRDRRMAEVQALQGLADGDAASAELWHLWYSERGPTAKRKLDKTDQLMGDATSWLDAEALLTSLIEEFGVYFVEPVNRLATLYYLQGRYDESFKLCRVILQIKPWHFGALSGIVQVCVAQRNRDAARQWAQQCLPNVVASSSFPPFSQDGPVNPLRIEWVKKAVSNAKEALKQAEQGTKKAFGEPEEYYITSNPSSLPEDHEPEGDVWQ